MPVVSHCSENETKIISIKGLASSNLTCLTHLITHVSPKPPVIQPPRPLLGIKPATLPPCWAAPRRPARLIVAASRGPKKEPRDSDRDFRGLLDTGLTQSVLEQCPTVSGRWQAGQSSSLCYQGEKEANFYRGN